MEKRINIEEKIIAKMYNTVSAMKPLTYTELRDEYGLRYFDFEIMLNDYEFDTGTLEIKLEEFFEVHDNEIETINYKLQFYDYEVVNEYNLKELNVIFRVLDYGLYYKCH